MDLKQKIMRNTALQLLGKITGVFLGLLAIGMMSRYLQPEKFGWYITAIGFLQFVGLISDFGFTVVTANMLSEPAFDKQKLLGNLFGWRLASAALFQLLAPLAFLLFPYPPTVKQAVFILTFSFFCISLNNIFIGYYQQQLKIIKQVIGELINRLILVAGFGLIIISRGGFMLTMLTISFGSLLYTAYLWSKMPKIKINFDKDISKAVFIKIWPTSISVMANAVYLQGDKVILPLYVSQTQTGFYGMAYRVVDIVTQMIAVSMGILMPVISHAWSRGLKEEYKKRLQMSFDLIIALAMPAAVGLFVLAKPIIVLIGGSEYAEAGVILRYLGLAIFGIAFGSVFGHVALAINRQKKAMTVFISASVLSLAGYLIFIPRYGVWGAVGVSLFSEFYAGAALLILIGVYSKIFPHLKTFVKTIIASLLMGFFAFQIQKVGVIMTIIASAIFYTGLLMLFKIISASELKQMFFQKNENVVK